MAVMKMWPDGRLNDKMTHTTRQNETETELFDYAQINVRQQKKQQFGFKIQKQGLRCRDVSYLPEREVSVLM